MKRGAIWVFVLGFICAVQAAPVQWKKVGKYLPGTTALRGITYTNNLYVAWGEKALVYSSDGINWQQGTGYGYEADFSGMKYVDGKFVAVSASGNAWSSSDGRKWQATTVSDASVITSGNTNTAFVNGTYTRVQFHGILRGPATNQLAMIEAPMVGLSSVAASGNVIVGVGEMGHLPVNSTALGRVLVSTDAGASFREVDPPQGTMSLASIRYANGHFVAVGQLGTIIVSADGVDWRKIATNITNDLFDVIYADGKWVVIGASGKVLVSSDGEVFVDRSIDTTHTLFGITHGNGKFVVTSGYHHAVYTSADAQTWTKSADVFYIWGVAFGNGRFVARTSVGSAVSADGINWEETRIAGGTLGLRIAFQNGWFVTGAEVTSDSFVSNDGLNWEPVSVDATFNFNGIDASDGKVWAVSSRSLLYRLEMPPKLTSSLTAEGKLQVNIDASQPGQYRIMAAESVNADTWIELDVLNVIGSAKWTNSASGTQFIQVRSE